MITISLCMIVKNEEPVLARCLDSVASLMDEIIIVDTGSTDQTKEIAARYTNKIYDFEWCNDFSKARNFSFSKATMEYIYVADADEVIDEVNQDRFIKLKQVLINDIDIVQMFYANQLENGTAYNYDREYRPKLFKRLRPFVWEEPVHEMVRLEPIIFDSEIDILHMPISNHGNRDFAIFEKQQRLGNRLSKRLHHMYAMELYISGNDEDFIKAIPTFEATISDKNRDIDELKEAFAVLSKAYLASNNLYLFVKTCFKDLATTATAELCYQIGEYCIHNGDKQEALMWFQNCIAETECILNIRYSSEYPQQRINQLTNS